MIGNAWAWGLAALLCVPSVARAIDSADDICGPAVNPCNITSAFTIDDGAVLDFGSRTVQILAGGRLDTGAGTVTLKCGKFASETGTTVGLKLRGPSGLGTIDGGNLLLEVTRRCSESVGTPCIKDSECDFGTCSSAVCSLDRARLCFDDSSCTLGNCGRTVCSRDSDRRCGNDVGCEVGPCNPSSRRCTLDPTTVCFAHADCSFGPCALSDPRCEGDVATSCTSNNDCYVGVCDVDVCTGKEGGTYRECAQDADCFDGACSAGDGSVRLNGKTDASGAEPGSLSVRAAGNIDVVQSIDFHATAREFDGGFLELESGQGAVNVSNTLVGSGGGLSTGGEVTVIAKADVVVATEIDVNGGDFDGGFVEFLAGRDLLITGNVLANSVAGAGLGGEIDGSADRDILISSLAKLLTNGHTSVDNFAGDGGSQAYYAGRDISVAAGVSLEADGSLPDGFGGVVRLESERNMTLSASIHARARGAQGGGGLIGARAGGAIQTTASGVFDVTGSASGGGSVEWSAAGNITHAGVIDARATNNGSPGSVLIESDADIAAVGDALLDGGPAGAAQGDVEIEACRINLNTGALVSNLGGGGITALIGHEQIAVNTGASVVNASNGTNLFRYRSEGKPPTVAGSVTPAFQGEIDPSLSPCPICGNSEVEDGESCEDGNTVDGDGCSARCQDEGCIVETPGYPSVPLCDDGKECTIDVCDSAAHSCEHLSGCDDGNECTLDSCVGGGCVYQPDDQLCDDGNDCTLDICGAVGCTHGGINQPCFDGIGCTGNDMCVAAECRGTDICPEGFACNLESDGCEPADGGCGDPTLDGRTTASDALFALSVAVGLQTCDVCVCDVDDSTSTTASDALRLLNFAVGIPGVSLVCPSC